MIKQDKSADPDFKYIVFNRNDFYEMMGALALPPYYDNNLQPTLGGDVDCAMVAQHIVRQAEAHELDDAVVIRRQDLFAGPALHTYASAIAITVRTNTDKEAAKPLQRTADYFHRQAVLADEEGWKLPD